MYDERRRQQPSMYDERRRQQPSMYDEPQHSEQYQHSRGQRQGRDQSHLRRDDIQSQYSDEFQPVPQHKRNSQSKSQHGKKSTTAGHNVAIGRATLDDMYETEEDIARYGVCLKHFVTETAKCEHIEGRLTDFYANAYKDEMEVMGRAFKRGRGREAMLFQGLGVTEEMNPAMRHLTQRTKVLTAYACHNQDSKCASTGVSESDVKAKLGTDPACPQKMLSDSHYGTQYGMQRRMSQLISVFSEYDDPTVFWGNSPAIGAAITVCSRIASFGSGDSISLTDAVDAYIGDGGIDKLKQIVDGHNSSTFMDQHDMEEDVKDPFILMNAVYVSLCDLAIPPGVLPWVVGFAHNGDFAHQGYWPEFWWISIANFHSELVMMDYGKGGVGPDSVGINTDLRNNFMLTQGATPNQDKYHADFNDLSLNAWWSFEFGLTYYMGQSPFTTTKNRLYSALASAGLDDDSTLAELLEYDNDDFDITFFPKEMSDVIEEAWADGTPDPKGQDEQAYSTKIARAACFFSIVKSDWYNGKKYLQIKEYYNGEGKTLTLELLMNVAFAGEKQTIDHTMYQTWFGGTDYKTSAGILLGIPVFSRGYTAEKGNPLVIGSRQWVHMFQFEADYPMTSSESFGTNENKLWMEYFELTKYEDMNLKAVSKQSDDLLKAKRKHFGPKAKKNNRMLLPNGNDHPHLDEINKLLTQLPGFQRTHELPNGVEAPISRYWSGQSVKLDSKKTSSTMAKSFPRVFEQIARRVIYYESPTDSDSDAEGAKKLEANMKKKFSYTMPSGHFCVAEDEPSWIYDSHSDSRLRFMIDFLVSWDGIMDEHHEFFYHDLYHAMIFGRTLGYQMDIAGDTGHDATATAFTKMAWVGYAAGLFHDTGYPILNNALVGKAMSYYRSNLPYIVSSCENQFLKTPSKVQDRMMLTSGKFGNMHELASLAYMMEAMWHYRSFRADTWEASTDDSDDEYIVYQDTDMSIEHRVLAAYAILASKIGSGGVHLQVSEVLSALESGSRKTFSYEMVKMIELPLQNAKGGTLEERQDAYIDYLQFRKLGSYALSLVYENSYFQPSHKNQVKIQTKASGYADVMEIERQKSIAEIGLLEQEQSKWQPAVKPFGKAFL
jgi:hypothetical protein